MGLCDACPTYPGKRYVDWELRDTGGESQHEMRAVQKLKSDASGWEAGPIRRAAGRS